MPNARSVQSRLQSFRYGAHGVVARKNLGCRPKGRAIAIKLPCPSDRRVGSISWIRSRTARILHSQSPASRLGAQGIAVRKASFPDRRSPIIDVHLPTAPSAQKVPKGQAYEAQAGP